MSEITDARNPRSEEDSGLIDFVEEAPKEELSKKQESGEDSEALVAASQNTRRAPSPVSPDEKSTDETTEEELQLLKAAGIMKDGEEGLTTTTKPPTQTEEVKKTPQQARRARKISRRVAQKCGKHATLVDGKCRCLRGFRMNDAGACECDLRIREVFNGECVSRCSEDKVRNAAGVCVCDLRIREIVDGKCLFRCSENQLRNEEGKCVNIGGAETIDWNMMSALDDLITKVTGELDEAEKELEAALTEEGLEDFDEFFDENIDWSEFEELHADVNET